MPRDPFRVISRLRGVERRKAEAEMGKAQQEADAARARLDAYVAERTEQADITDRLSPQQLESLRIRGIVEMELLQAAADEYEKLAEEHRKSQTRWSKSVSDHDAAEKLEERRREEQARVARWVAERSVEDLFVLLRSREETS